MGRRGVDLKGKTTDGTGLVIHRFLEGVSRCCWVGPCQADTGCASDPGLASSMRPGGGGKPEAADSPLSCHIHLDTR